MSRPGLAAAGAVTFGSTAAHGLAAPRGTMDFTAVCWKKPAGADGSGDLRKCCYKRCLDACQ